MTDRKKGETFC